MTYLDMKQLRYCLQKKKWFWKINPENHFHSHATRTSLPNSISIHDTLAGIDRYPQSAGAAGFISIHDTLAGIDTVGVRPAFAMPHFNPRYPRRYRLQNCTKTFHSISSLSTIYTFFSHITIPSAPYITILSYFLSNISGANLPLIGCALHIRTTQILTHFKPAFNYYP